MGIQINGQTDTITATDGSLSIQGASGNLTGNLTGDVTGNVTGNVTGDITIGAGSTSAPSLSPSGDSNTGVFFPSADTIAFAEGGSEAARIDSSGNLGIGTNSVPNWAAGGFLAVQNKTASLVSSGSQDAFLTSNAYYDGAWKYQNTGVARNIYMNSDGLVFRMAPSGSANASITWTEAARFNNTGNLVFPSGQGIDFSASSNAAGMTSELLSDYEEGTWTPTISSGYTSITYSNQHGWYTKVGRLAVVSARVLFSGTSNSTQIQVGSLPFTAANLGGGAYGGGGIPYSTLSEITNTSPYVGGSTNYVNFYTLGTGGAINSSGSASTKWISFVVSYSV